MSDDPEIDTEIKETKKSIENISNTLLLEDILFFLKKGVSFDLDIPKEYREQFKQIKETYQLGLKFEKNQKKIGTKKYILLNNSEEECLRELAYIKLLWSRRTFYRYKKIFKERFGYSPKID